MPSPNPSTRPGGRLRDLTVVYRSPGELKAPTAQSAHPLDKQIQQIAASIKRSASPTRCSSTTTAASSPATAGSRRPSCSASTTVPTIRLSSMTEAQKRAYVIADNKLALNAGWDARSWRIELQELVDLDLDFDIDDHRLRDCRDRPADRQVVEAAAADADARRCRCRTRDRRSPGRATSGSSGPHRLLCGDAADAGRSTRACWRRAGADGLHRPALQRADRRPCLRLGASSTASSPWPRAR